MYSYQIWLKLDTPNYINYGAYEEQFKKAQVQFNENSTTRGNGRFIEKIEWDMSSFVVTLKSTDALDKPSKALAKFSRLLMESGKFNDYVVGNHLLRSTKYVDNSKHNKLSDTKLLTTLIQWILDDKNTSAIIKERKREAIEEIKKVILSTGVII